MRKYLLQGGSIWADNGRPGRRSLFDIAFRREMKRVLPDRNFKQIGMEHPVYKSFFQFKKVPEGMNWRDEPIEVIEIDRRAVVLYTLNDYGDLWETRLREDGTVDTSLDENWHYVWGPHWHSAYHGGRQKRWRDPRPDYENLNEESINNACKLGVNVVVYFLTAR